MRINAFVPSSRTRIHCALALITMIAACSSYTLNPPDTPPSAADKAQVVDPREIVALVPNARKADQLRTGAAARGFAFREETDLAGLDMVLLRFEFPQPLDGAGAIATLETLEPTATAGVNHAYRVSQSARQGLDRFDYANRLLNWPEQGCTARARIGMIDTGVDLAALTAKGAQVTTQSFAPGALEATAHGTDVASILVDPRRLRDVELYSAAVVRPGARGDQEAGVDDILKALDWLAAQGVPVVNISLSGPYNKLLDRGVDTAERLGMTLVAAVGNEGPSAQPRFPAAFDNVIAVTAVDANGEVFRNAVHGPHVDIAAPGVDILVEKAGAGQRFATGTSMAAPFVTAMIASDISLLRADPQSLRRWFRSTSRDLGSPGVDSTFGAGLMSGPGDC